MATKVAILVNVVKVALIVGAASLVLPAMRWLVVPSLGVAGFWAMRALRNVELVASAAQRVDVNLVQGRPQVRWPELVGAARVLPAAQVLSRRTNFRIAMTNAGLLDAMSAPPPFLLWLPGGARAYRGVIQSRTMDWAIDFCVLSAITTPTGGLAREVRGRGGPAAALALVRKRVVSASLLAIVAGPVFVCYYTAAALLRYAERLRSSPSSLLGARQWSPRARWLFRDFNELPHTFERRLARANVAANLYFDDFESPMVRTLAQFGSFAMGVAMALVVGLSLQTSGSLDFFVIPGTDDVHVSSLYALATLGALLSMFRSALPEEFSSKEPSEHLRRLASHTHHYPPSWRNGELPHDAIRAELNQLYEVKPALFAYEIVAMLAAPWLFYRRLLPAAPELLRFVLDYGEDVEGLGFVCRFASFRIGDHGNAAFGAPRSAPRSWRTRHGKLEMSVLTFKAENPEWTPADPDAQQFLESMGAPSTTAALTSLGASAAGWAPRASGDAPSSTLGVSEDGLDTAAHLADTMFASTLAPGRRGGGGDDDGEFGEPGLDPDLAAAVGRTGGDEVDSLIVQESPGGRAHVRRW